MIQSTRFLMRPLVASDVTKEYLGWFSDDAVKKYITAAKTVQSTDSLRSFIIERSNREDVLFLGIFDLISGYHIGNIKFEPICRASRIATMGILIGSKDWRGRGVAREVLASCANWLYENAGIETLILGVHQSNLAAIRSYQTAGFELETIDTLSQSIRMVRNHSRSARKLVLGSAQFGFKYGLANQEAVSRSAIESILACAWEAGVSTIDTAIAYGSSEEQLGLSEIAQWRVISKIPTVPNSISTPNEIEHWVRGLVEQSLKKLNLNKLHGMLLHSTRNLDSERGRLIIDALSRMKDEAIIANLGISIYDPKELALFTDRADLDIVQAPLNPIDRRIITSGWGHRLQRMGVALHARSIFLQGLLLSRSAQQSDRFSRWGTQWSSWNTWLNERGMTPLEACVRYVKGLEEVSKVVVGVDTKSQIVDIAEAVKMSDIRIPDFLASEDLQLINPSNWPKLN